MRSLVLGNGSLTILIDSCGSERDFYYPYVGQENHFDRGLKLGVWTANKFDWLDSGKWSIKQRYEHDSLTTVTKAESKELAIAMHMFSAVHHEKNVYVKKLVIKNTGPAREFRIFFSPHFSIYGNDEGNTAYFHPRKKAIIFYKGKRYFLMSGINNGKKGFDDYACGVAHFRGLRGTYVDAEDGILSKNPIEHGSVDATIGFKLHIDGGEESVLYFYIVAGKKHREIEELDKFVTNYGPEEIINATRRYWRRWLKESKLETKGLDKKEISLLKRSLLVVRAHQDNNGGIIASCDADVLRQNKDGYNYIWPRDGAFCAIALDNAGHHSLAKKFFRFCTRIIAREGFMLPKYNPDYSAGSSWHPWFKHGTFRLPIQEDETALVLFALAHHYEHTDDRELVRELWPQLIRPAAEFMCSYRDKGGLPGESYNLWEEKFGIHTFTACSVYAGLVSAAKLARAIGKKKNAEKYERNAREIKQAIKKYLINKATGYFYKRIHHVYGELLKYDEIDSSTAFGLWFFRVYPIEHEQVSKEIARIKQKLSVKGGIARYENDAYWKPPHARCAGNPWFITTLWLADYYIEKAKSKEELKEAKKLIEWVVEHATPEGLFPEQLTCDKLEPASVCPLAWSHAGFINTILAYARKLSNIQK